MAKNTRYPVELHERAVRLVLQDRANYPSDWAAMTSVAEKCGVSTETLRKWVRKAELTDDAQPTLTTVDVSPNSRRITELERENGDLRRENHIFKRAAALFARELEPQLSE